MKILIGLLLLSTLVFSPQRALAAPNSDVAQFVTAFNAGTAGAIGAYVRAHVLPATPGAEGPDAAQSLEQLRQAIGTVTVATVQELPRRIVATVRSKSSGWYRINFVRAPQAAPHRFARIVTDLGLPPKPSGQSTQQYLSVLSSAGYFSGVVLSAAANARPVVAAVGLANRAAGVQNTADTLFNIGSIGKLFTTTAIYQLIEKGVLHKSDTIGKWLPDYPNVEARQATIDQLLSMRSGIGDFFNPRFFQGSPERIRTLQDYVPFFAADPLAFKPGTSQMYSNGGFLVLGLIIEKASGQDFYSYVREHIFDPAGMTNSSYPPIDEVLPNRALGYTRQWSDLVTYRTELHPALQGEPGRGSSAGGAFSTAGDLFKFSQALQNGSLVKGRYEWNGPGNFYAGGTPGWNAALDIEKGSTTIVLANLDPPAAENLVENLQP
jgi:CubicO group peptidase (beta-lactamase class C family)